MWFGVLVVEVLMVFVKIVSVDVIFLLFFRLLVEENKSLY